MDDRLGRNKFRDDLYTLYDESDQTKLCKFQLSGITANTLRTLTVPDASGTIALTSDLTAGNLNFHTSGFGRFDSGIGVGVDPDSINLLNIFKDSSNRAEIKITNDGAGDAIVGFYDDGLKWILGHDTADDSFKIDQSVSIGGFTGAQDFVLDTSGNLTINNDITAGGSFSGTDYDGIALMADANGFNLTGGTTPRTLVVTGADVTLNQNLRTTDSPTFAGLTIPTTGEINFRDIDISIGSTTDGILDMSADVSIDMFYDNAAIEEGTDGQKLNIIRRSIQGADDYIRLYVDKNRKGLIGFSGDDDLLQLATNLLTVNGSAIVTGSLTVDTTTLVVNASGYENKVGIGTTTPGYIFDINAGEIGDNNYDGLRIIDTGWKATSHPMLEFYNSHASFNGPLARIYGEIGNVGTNSKLYFAVADSSKSLQDRMVIDKDGNVGINENSPQYKLEVNGTIGCGAITSQGKAIFDVTDTEALLVRQDSDANDVFAVDTTNRRIGVNNPNWALSPTAHLYLVHPAGAAAKNASDSHIITMQSTGDNEQRVYFRWNDVNGAQDWVMGKNADSTFILYGSGGSLGAHRLLFIEDGITYIDSAGIEGVRINANTNANSGTGGFSVFDGGTSPAPLFQVTAVTSYFYNDLMMKPDGSTLTAYFRDADTLFYHPVKINANVRIGSLVVPTVALDVTGEGKFSSDLEIDGALNHDGSTVGFYGTVSVTQNQLATGAGKTVDEVITELQRFGLVRQAA